MNKPKSFFLSALLSTSFLISTFAAELAHAQPAPGREPDRIVSESSSYSKDRPEKPDQNRTEKPKPDAGKQQPPQKPTDKRPDTPSSRPQDKQPPRLQDRPQSKPPISQHSKKPAPQPAQRPQQPAPNKPAQKPQPNRSAPKLQPPIHGKPAPKHPARQHKYRDVVHVVHKTVTYPTIGRSSGPIRAVEIQSLTTQFHPKTYQITTADVRRIITNAAEDASWQVKSRSYNRVEATYRSGTFSAIVSIKFTTNKYTISYVNSGGLYFDRDYGYIDEAYMYWIYDLDNAIDYAFQSYFNPGYYYYE